MAIVAVIFVLTLLGGVPMAFVLGLTGIAHLLHNRGTGIHVHYYPAAVYRRE